MDIVCFRKVCINTLHKGDNDDDDDDNNNNNNNNNNNVTPGVNVAVKRLRKITCSWICFCYRSIQFNGRKNQNAAQLQFKQQKYSNKVN
jgi:hypothetical protein